MFESNALSNWLYQHVIHIGVCALDCKLCIAFGPGPGVRFEQRCGVDNSTRLNLHNYPEGHPITNTYAWAWDGPHFVVYNYMIILIHFLWIIIRRSITVFKGFWHISGK